MKKYRIKRNKKTGNYMLQVFKEQKGFGFWVSMRIDIPSELLETGIGRVESMIFSTAVPPSEWGTLKIELLRNGGNSFEQAAT